jgi:signal transduction histidine kinase
MPYRRIFFDGQTEYIEKKDSGLISIAWIPFIANNQVLGAVYFATSKIDTFSENDKIILEALSKEVGSVIQKELLKEQLEESNTLANLYLDIMAHDINNTNAISLMYSELLEEMLDGEKKEIAKKVSKAVLRSAEIIANVSTIRKIHEEKVKIKPVSIDQIIKLEIEATSDVSISYTESGTMVCADALLSEVFANLIGNSIKFGGFSVKIIVEVECR